MAAALHLSRSFALPVAAPEHPSTLPDAVWRADQMGSYRSTPVPSGYQALDRELPNGGWPPSVLIELLMAQPGIGELRLLAPALARLTQADKTVILLGPPHIPYPAALEDLGIRLKKLILIETDKPADRIWAIEQTLKSASFGALLCWLPQARTDHLRRLQLAAAGGEGLSFVFRPLNTQDTSSPAPLRIACQPAAAGRMSVELIKRRGPIHAAPLILPLAIPEILRQPLTHRMSGKTFSDTSTYAVDRPTLAATAARRRATLPA
ncbi:translesion DNA synthesis-associated protein ImuA [Herminiimonas sp. KBW02]|uniref:translesion DNA synthesis-associated protein ImuA n=1 Tax=Herminiimonas sp. KBW02 TaxID=2153363 RepID=UPI000F594263|nr:translesion DNA synthesis-associated protein ImuA [Herminiimonas sp. KBW02]RQO38477.1 translesion DNA synthesis-associated protein ImuA [Herminiimonas sp. KBW02]